MSNITDKSPGDTFSSGEFNQNNTELKNVIQQSGQTPSSGDLAQEGQALARFSTAASACVESGIANAYVLTTVGAGSLFDSPSLLQDGAMYRAQITTPNTGASTVNVNGLGVKSIKKDNYTSELVIGDILAGQYGFIWSTSKDAFELVTFTVVTIPDPVVSKGRLVKVLSTSGTLIKDDNADDTIQAYLTSLDIKSGTYLAKLTGAGSGSSAAGGQTITYTGAGGAICWGIVTITSNTAFVVGLGGIGGNPGAVGGNTTLMTLTAGGGLAPSATGGGGNGGIGGTATGGFLNITGPGGMHAVPGGGGPGGGPLTAPSSNNQNAVPKAGTGTGGSTNADGGGSVPGDGGDGELELYEWTA